ncbi:MAG: histidine--tRNA ligase [Patescibacteria group bacterium]|nr:histidine--tRNA ligase [Patescibacteria group bacterium]
MKIKTQRPRGMRDVFGDESDFYLKIRDLITNFSVLNGFRYVETPLVENIKTFTSSLGESSDVVSKEMFVIKGKEKGDVLVLRPEGTAGVIRAYFENGWQNFTQPVSVFYLGKMFRRERPQYGRLREHTQWGIEIINSEDPFADFFTIFVFFRFLNQIKIRNFKVKINSLGCQRCRRKYRTQLINFYKKYKNKICVDCQRRLTLNPLRLLDCKNPQDQEYKKKAPNILNYLCKFCELHFQKVIEFLDYFKIPYELDSTLVRGFDYYSRTVFEIFVENEEIALGGGGRYDLGEIMSNIPLPSCGGAMGIERLKIILDKIDFKIKKSSSKIFVAFAGEETKAKAFEIFLDLQGNNFFPVANFFKSSLSGQLDYANKLGIKHALILGFHELGQGTIILKDMEYGSQEILKLSNLTKELKKIVG